MMIYNMDFLAAFLKQYSILNTLYEAINEQTIIMIKSTFYNRDAFRDSTFLLSFDISMFTFVLPAVSIFNQFAFL